MPALADEVRLILAVLTCYRLAQLIPLDDGPMFVFRDLRKELNSIASRGGKFQENIAEFFSCPFCMGIWYAIPCALAYLWPSNITDIILLVIGIAGGQAFLEGRRYNDA